MKLQSVIIISIFLLYFNSIKHAQTSHHSENVYHQQGLISLEEGNIDEAENLFKYSVRDFSYGPSYYELAKIELSKNTVQSRARARKYIRKAIWKEEKNIEYRLLLAKLLRYFSRTMAEDAYEEILEIEPGNIVALYNLGKLHEEEFYEYHKSVRQDEFSPALSLESYAMEDFLEAEQLFIKIIELNPKYNDAYMHLGFLYLEVKEYRSALLLMQKAVGIDSLNKDAYLYLGYLYYKIAEFDSSFITYKNALELMDIEERGDFVENSTMLLLKEDLINVEGRAEQIDKFWQTNDPLLLTDYNERLLEHYSRVAYSNLKFSVEKQRLAGWKSDRGEILVRYGEPVNRVRFRPYINAGGRTQLMLKTDVWIYKDKTFGFTDDYWTGNFRFSIPNTYGRHFSQFPFDTETYMESLRRINPDDYEPKYKGPVFTLPFNIVQFKNLDDENNGTQIFLNYALDVSDNFEFRNRYKLPHQTGLFLLDNEKYKINELVENYSYLSNDKELKFSSSEKYWINSLEMNAKPDSGILAFEIIKEKDGSVSTNHFNFKVKDFNTENLEISDIVLATKVEQSNINKGSIVRNNLGILPNPKQVFTAGIDMYLYYELYNLTQDSEGKTDFEQRITLKKLSDNSVIDDIFSSIAGLFGSNSDDEFTLVTNYQSFEKNTQVYLQLDMSKYQPGDYILKVTVEDNLGSKEISEETLFSWRK